VESLRKVMGSKVEEGDWKEVEVEVEDLELNLEEVVAVETEELK